MNTINPEYLNPHVMVVARLSALQFLLQCLLIMAKQAGANHHSTLLGIRDKDRDKIIYVDNF